MTQLYMQLEQDALQDLQSVEILMRYNYVLISSTGVIQMRRGSLSLTTDASKLLQAPIYQADDDGANKDGTAS